MVVGGVAYLQKLDRQGRMAPDLGSPSLLFIL